MKKLLAMVLICCMLFSIAGCSTEKPETSTSTTSSKELPNLSKQEMKELGEKTALEDLLRYITKISITEKEIALHKTEYRITNVKEIASDSSGGVKLEYIGEYYLYNDYGYFIREGNFSIEVSITRTGITYKGISNFDF